MKNGFEKLKGRFIVVDGPDGAGKSTQLNAIRSALIAEGLEVQLAVDPGGTPTGQEIRNILLHSKQLEISPVCETFLFMASRAQLVAEVVRPAIESGKVVLCDRFISSTVAYQGALDIDADFIISLGKQAVGQTWPDLTIILDLPSDIGLERVGKDKDRMESRGGDYHRKVREKFLALGDIYPGEISHVCASGSIEEVTQNIIAALEEFCSSC